MRGTEMAMIVAGTTKMLLPHSTRCLGPDLAYGGSLEVAVLLRQY